MEGLRNGKGTRGDGGSPITRYKVQWKESTDNWDTPEDVSEEAVQSTTHTIRDLTGDMQYDVRVVASNDVGDGAASEQVSGIPQPGNTPPVGSSAISGSARVGETLRADVLGISDADGLTEAVFSYQWIRVDTESTESDIADATAFTYTLVDDDQGKTIKVKVSFTDDADNEETLTSTATGSVAALPNSPATGAPTISGTAQVGETLAAHTSDIGDDDRLTNVAYNYQWIANDGTADTDIQDATGPTYTLVSADEGKTIKVRVSFTDDGANEETLTSTATEAVSFAVQQQQANSPATGAPTIRGTALVGETLTADTSGIADTDGLTNVTFSYQWIRNDGSSDSDIQNATASSYTLAAADEGKTIQVKVSFTDDADNGETLISGSTASVSAKLNQGSVPDAPDLPIGTAVFVGGVDLEWNEVPAADSYAVQLYRNGQWVDLPGDGVEIAFYGAGAIISGLDPDLTLWFQVRAKNAHGSSEWSDFSSLGSTSQFRLGRRARPANVPASGAPVINGTAQAGETLTADTTGIEDGNGLARVQFRFQWVSHDGSADTDIAGATDSTYTLAASEEGKSIKVRVAFTDRGGYAESLTSAATATVAAAPNSPATGAPTISGTAQVGETLTADTSGIADADGLSGATFTYQWIANDGTADTDIQDATDSSYTLVAADEGQTIKVRVSFTDDAGNGESLTSAATAAAAARPNTPATGVPTISGTAQVGETLTADTSGISDADGLTNVSFSYQWIRSDGSTDTNIAGQTTSKYTLVSADEGQTIKVRVSFTDDAGNQETLTSAPTAVVAAPAQVDSENEPSAWNHLTVVVTEDDSDPDDVVSTFTITWNDAEDCSASYNAYLDGVVGDPIHLGSAASEGEQIAASLTNVSAESIGFNAKLYCRTIGSGRLVDSLWIPEYSRSFDTVPISRAYLPKPGTYSTEPGLIALTVSSGTLTPAFHNHTLNYTVPDVPNADGRFTLTTTAKADYYNVAFLPGSYYTFFSVCSHGGQQTSLSYGDDAGNRIYPLTDADANTPGFQMELDEGENVFKIRVWPNCENGHVYKLTVTRTANAPANTPATGTPAISGIAQVGETLTADTAGIADADGLANVTYSYQWIVNDGTADTDIADATDSTYTLVAAAEGKTIKVRVSFTDDADNDETLTSAATGEVEALPNRPATGAPSISGTAQVGEALTADTSGIADDDGLNNVSYSYQWIRNDGSSDTDITDATGSTYPLAADDEGQTIKVKVTFTDDADNGETLTSTATVEVAAAAPTEPPGRPRNLTGTANSDGTVTLSWDAPNDDSVTGYQILRRRPREGESTLLVHVNDTGSTAAEYTDNDVTPDVVHAYRVKAINAVGLSKQSNFVSVTPAQPAGPAQNNPATGTLTISGSAQVGETLTADTTGIADADGLTNVSYSYQWTRLC